MKSVAVFIGTRPEAIKMAPIIKAVVEVMDIRPIVVATYQHGEMLQQVIDLLGIKTYRQMGRVKNPYGDGNAAERIVKVIREQFAQPGLGLYLP